MHRGTIYPGTKRRGPVTSCVTYEYTPDGKLLTCHAPYDGSEWVTTQIYDAIGRLTKIVSGKLGGPPRSRCTLTMTWGGSSASQTIRKKAVESILNMTRRVARLRSRYLIPNICVVDKRFSSEAPGGMPRSRRVLEFPLGKD